MIYSTFKDTLNEMLKNGSFYIALGIAILILLTIVILLVMNRKKDRTK